ncbi:MAG: polysaccharide deacetylase [Actinomycetota bacterium]|jgi:peptidoglycan-N-acetylglucosamine deacetylase|nr:polysaccharide deacetylase [Actinomycetota bacterium]
MTAAVSVCLSFDFDAISLWVGPRGSRSPNLIARGEFGPVGAGRLLDLMGERQIPTTWFIPGHTIDTYTEVCARIAEEGHEIGYHGYCHEAPSSARDIEDERAILAKAMDRIESLTGAPPVGHRVPGGNVGDRWVELLVENGFSYDSSMAPNDFTPTWCRTGDIARTDGPHHFGERVDLVELPFDWSLDDWPFFSYDSPYRDGLRSPAEVYDMWAGEFDYLVDRVGEGVFVLTMHPQCIGRGSRMLMIERLLDHMAAHENVRFTTMAVVAEEFRAAATS